MLASFNRHVVWPLVARRRGSRHLDYARRLENSQYAAPEAVAANQLAQLRRQLRHCYDTVPYYQRTWTAAGVHPSDIRTLADLEHVPVVTKQDIRTHGDEMLSTVGDRTTWRLKTTSGSTGVPLRVYMDEPAAQWKAACTLRADQWSGYRLGERVAKVWGNPEYRREGLRGRLRNGLVDRAHYLDTIHLTDDRILAFARHLARRRPGLVFGHAHSLYLVACSMKRAGLTHVRPNGVVSTAMPLHAWQRAVIEEVFGVRVTDRYGCEEVSLIACECEHGTGLHVAAESVIAETPADGNLLLTDLVNRAMPLVRYRVGDVAPGLVTARCPCGRGLPRLTSVQGREADFVVTPAGTLISGISLTENFAMHIPGVAQLQLVQESRTLLLLRLVRGDGYTPRSVDRIRELVGELFGPRMRHEVEYVDAIAQEPSGKYRFCISKVATDDLKELSA